MNSVFSKNVTSIKYSFHKKTALRAESLEYRYSVQNLKTLQYSWPSAYF